VSLVENGTSLQSSRALEELAAVSHLRRQTLAKLMRLVPRVATEANLDSGLLVDAICSSQSRWVVSESIRALGRLDLSFNAEEVGLHLAILARFGPQAKAGIPTVRAQLQTATNEYQKAYLRAVLASLGDKNKDLADAIRNDLMQDESRHGVVGAIVVARQPQWVSQDIIRIITEQLTLRSGWSERCLTALALASMGPRANVSKGVLTRLYQKALSEEHASACALPFGLAIARVEPKTQKMVLVKTIRDFPRMFKHFGHASLASALATCRLLIDDEIRVELVRLLGDHDRELADGAMTLLTWAGPSRGFDYARLLAMARKCARTDRRADCENLLKRLATYRDLPLLRKTFSKERDREMKGIIAAVISSVENLEEPDALSLLPRSIRELLFKDRRSP
jgi:hypothetical protein